MSDKFPFFVNVSESDALTPLFVKIFRDADGLIKAVGSDGKPFPPAKADGEGSPATEEEFLRAKKAFLASMPELKFPFFSKMEEYGDEPLFVKVDLKPGTDVTFGVTSDGRPFPPGEALRDGVEATEEEFNGASKKSSAPK